MTSPMSTNDGQLTPTQVAAQLASLARELDRKIQAMEHADREAIEKRGAADLAYSRAFLAAEGSMDLRKHQATIETHDQRMTADVADAVVRHLRREVDSIKTRVDVGRSVNSAVKTELDLLGLRNDQS